MIITPESTVLQAMLRSAEEAAPRLAVETTAGGVHNATEIEHVIKSFAQKPNGGLVVLPYAVTVSNASTIIALARQYQMPDIYALAEFVAAGGLVSYGLDWDDQFRRAAGYVDQILRGTKPADLPVQASTKFELFAIYFDAMSYPKTYTPAAFLGPPGGTQKPRLGGAGAASHYTRDV